MAKELLAAPGSSTRQARYALDLRMTNECSECWVDARNKLQIEEKTLENLGATGARKEKEVVAYFESAAQTWDLIYRRKDVWGVIHQQRLARFVAIVDELSLPAGTHVADLGCGAG